MQPLNVVYKTTNKKVPRPFIAFRDKAKAETWVAEQKTKQPAETFSIRQHTFAKERSKAARLRRKEKELDAKQRLEREDIHFLADRYGIFMSQAAVPYINLCPKGQEECLMQGRPDFVRITTAPETGLTGNVLDGDVRTETITKLLGPYGTFDPETNTFVPHDKNAISAKLKERLLARIAEITRTIEEDGVTYLNGRYKLDPVELTTLHDTDDECPYTWEVKIVISYNRTPAHMGQTVTTVENHVIPIGDDDRDPKTHKECSLSDFVFDYLLNDYGTHITFGDEVKAYTVGDVCFARW